jgi:hypothetical protein
VDLAGCFSFLIGFGARFVAITVENENLFIFARFGLFKANRTDFSNIINV